MSDSSPYQHRMKSDYGICVFGWREVEGRDALGEMGEMGVG